MAVWSLAFGGLQVGSALLHAHFQLVISAAQGFLRAAALAPDLGLAQLALHSRAEPRQLVLHHIVVRARLHGADGRLFRDVAGDDDERQVEPFLFDQSQGGEAVETGQPVVGDDEIPGLPFESGHKGFRRLDTAADRGVAGALQFEVQQHRVVGRILDDQYLEWPVHNSKSRVSGTVK